MEVPGPIECFFSGSGGINIMASPALLRQHTGKARVYLPAYDIYHGGKDKGGKTVYTRYKILGKESMHNTIQGILEVKIIEGYGLKKDTDTSSEGEFMRPNDIKKLMTEGSTSIKRNSVVVLDSGLLVRLEDIENFCDLPIIERTRLFQSQTHMAISKREAYKTVRGNDNWAHAKRGALARDMERSVHKLLLPYYRKYAVAEGDDTFFRTFMEDLVSVCNAHHTNFVEGKDFGKLITDTMLTGSKRKDPFLFNETRPRKKWGGSKECGDVPVPLKEPGLPGPPGPNVDDDVWNMVKGSLKRVSRSKIESIRF